MSTHSLLVHGTPEPPRKPLLLRAGPLDLRFEPATVFLRRICLGEVEIMRGIYAAVRDRDWGTVPPKIANLELKDRVDSFELTFDVDCQAPGIHFRWKGHIGGTPDGAVTFHFSGEALTTFLRNRIGLCVLHPIRECRGAPARYLDADGVEHQAAFPDTIEPQIFGKARFSRMRSLAHKVHPGLWAQLVFEGDEFEMEDQRNWTDASFKTYCTPLGLPFPVLVESGTRIEQRVTLRLVNEPGGDATILHDASNSGGRKTPADEPVLELALPPVPSGSLPLLGVQFAADAPALSPGQSDLLRKLRLAHIRADLHLSEGNAEDVLARAAHLAGTLDTSLELAVHLPREPAYGKPADLASVIGTLGNTVARVMAFEEGNWVSTRSAVERMRMLLPSMIPVGGGSNAHFCELNRAQALGEFRASEVDFVCWPVTPQVHAFDNLSIMENVESQGETVVSARAFCGAKPLGLSPVTLKPRFNAVATSGQREAEAGALPPRYDSRQASQFTAAWTLASIAGLAAAGVHTVTYYETHGWGGLIQAEAGMRPVADFPAEPGVVYPVYEVFAAVAGFDQWAPLPAAGRPPGLTGICLFAANRPMRVLVAETSGASRSIEIRVPASRVSVRVVHALNVDGFSGGSGLPSNGRSSLELPPYAVAIIDVVS